MINDVLDAGVYDAGAIASEVIKLYNIKWKMETLNYKPFKNGFPYKLLKYLYENGTSAGVDVQKEIGLNAHFVAKGVIYSARASQTFDSITHLLQVKGLVKFLPNDYYELTKVGKEFIENYKKR